jgi:hypothetical protein
MFSQNNESAARRVSVLLRKVLARKKKHLNADMHCLGSMSNYWQSGKQEANMGKH